MTSEVPEPPAPANLSPGATAPPAADLPGGGPEDVRALALRVARAIAVAETILPEAQPRAIVFRAGALRLALPLAVVREVVLPPDRLSRVPRAPEALLGIMNLRGRVVPVVDLLRALPPSIAKRLPESPIARIPGDDLATGRLLILEHGRWEIGLLVRTVERIAPLPDRLSQDPILIDPEEIESAINSLAR